MVRTRHKVFKACNDHALRKAQFQGEEEIGKQHPRMNRTRPSTDLREWRRIGSAGGNRMVAKSSVVPYDSEGYEAD